MIRKLIKLGIIGAGVYIGYRIYKNYQAVQPVPGTQAYAPEMTAIKTEVRSFLGAPYGIRVV